MMLDDRKIERLVQDNVKKLSIKTPSSKTQIQSLSGGNQQRCWSAAGWPIIQTCLFWMNPPEALMWARNMRYIVLLPTWLNKARASS